MYPRTEYEMSEQDLEKILKASQAVPAMMIGGYTPPSPQENANRAWRQLGDMMGFDYTTVRPVTGKGQRFFTAVPLETEEAKAERMRAAEDQRRRKEIRVLKDEIREREDRLKELQATNECAGP